MAGADAPPAIEFRVDRFAIQGENPIGEAAAQAVLTPYLGEYSGLEGLYAAADALEQALADSGYAFHRVIVPPQTLEGGEVALEVVTFSLGNVTVRGNQHFSEEIIRRSLPVLSQPGIPNTGRLSQQLAVANEHPRRHVGVNFRESETAPDTLDAVINVRDQRPWTVFAGLDNIGNKDTGYTRLSVGGQYANPLGLDDILTGTFITSPDNADDVMQYGFFYQVPVYVAGGWASGFYVKSDVDVGAVQDFFDVSGSGEFIGLSFRRPLMSVGRYRHALTVALQDRQFDTGIFNTFTGTFIPGISNEVRSRPLSARYDGGYGWTATTFDFYVELVQNMSFGGHNNDAAYASVRPGAEAGWHLVRFGATASQQLPYGLTGIARVLGQWTNEPLIPGEQFGLGGERSVRGFEERTIAADQGLQGNLEIWTPTLPQLYDIRLLAFVDAGHKQLEQPGAGQLPTDTLSSAGVGARWQWRNQLFVALDYGQPIANAGGEASDRGNAKWHFKLQYRY